ncbi:MAG: hypothetical protein LBL39_05110 [Planctomycetaceae bacterium]|jgi:hypothetical protein|nr:hypothetical protein [Planctomycetaceae bacterium]
MKVDEVRLRKSVSCVLIYVFFALIYFLFFGFTGCGTTKWSDTARTGTEQLLISNAIDSAVGKINFRPLGERRVYLNTAAINDVTDNKYLTMALRQHLATSGGILCDKEADADYIVDIRAGAIGTDRDDLLVGVPSISMPSIPGATISGAVIPEIPFVRRTKQVGVAKLAVFAYNKNTGRPIWASGNSTSESTAKNFWFAGTGPLTYGTIYGETTFAGHAMPTFVQRKRDKKLNSFADQARYFKELPNEPLLKDKLPDKSEKKPVAIATNIPATTSTPTPPSPTPITTPLPPTTPEPTTPTSPIPTPSPDPFPQPIQPLTPTIYSNQ